MSTVCSMGEASMESSSCEVRNPSTCATDNSKVRFGKTKRLKNGELFEFNRNSCRFTALPKRGSGEGTIASGLSKPISLKALILRVRRSGKGPESNPESLPISAQWLRMKSRDPICLVWGGRSREVPQRTKRIRYTHFCLLRGVTWRWRVFSAYIALAPILPL